ncbi:metallophosphoesterase family protein [Bacillus sp. AK128]
MKPITFLHTADLHLDSPYTGLKFLPDSLLKRVQESSFVSLHTIIDLAISKNVDFVIIAGDLYDSEQRSLRAQIRLRNEFLRLQSAGIQVYIVHGNHDPLNGNWIQLEWPANVHFYSDQIEVKSFKKEGKHLANLYGFSYLDKAVTDNMAINYEKGTEPCYHIAILHGTLASNKDHNPYAPFLLSDIKVKGFDYWALGHIHQRQVVHSDPPVIYPGNIQGRHRKETGEKGCYIVSMNEGETRYSFEDTCDILWERIKLSVTEVNSIDEFIHVCKQEMEQLRRTKQGVMVFLEVTGSGHLTDFLTNSVDVEEILDILHSGEENRTNFVWFSSIHYQARSIKDKDQLKKELHFLGDLLQQFENYQEFNEDVAPLYTHKDARRFLSPLEESEKSILKEEAENWIINELFKTST